MRPLFPFEDPVRHCLKVHEWPGRDQELWHSLFVAGDILDGTAGAGNHWSEETRGKYCKGYGRWLTFLITSSQYEPDTEPWLRITSGRVRHYISELQEQVAPWTIWGRIAELLAVARGFSPDEDWAWLKRVERFLDANGHDSKIKTHRLRPAHEIATWAYTRMDEILADPPLRDPASNYRDALMVGLLITCPAMRLKNLTMIRIGMHLTKGHAGYSLNFAPEETKTDRPMSLPVPESLTPYIDHYIEQMRPRLMIADDTDRLWITRYGQPLNKKCVFDRITTVTRRVFGEPINPHLFRDCAVTTVAVDDPEHIGTAPHILGHTDQRTTEKHYMQANALVAGRRLRQSVDALKKQHLPHAEYKEN
jgi:integrase/recombinase XerD